SLDGCPASAGRPAHAAAAHTTAAASASIRSIVHLPDLSVVADPAAATRNTVMSGFAAGFFYRPKLRPDNAIPRPGVLALSRRLIYYTHASPDPFHRVVFHRPGALPPRLRRHQGPVPGGLRAVS